MFKGRCQCEVEFFQGYTPITPENIPSPPKLIRQRAHKESLLSETRRAIHFPF